LYTLWRNMVLFSTVQDRTTQIGGDNSPFAVSTVWFACYCFCQRSPLIRTWSMQSNWSHLLLSN
jgi:hypothetical protein